jgi:pimeloyl-ACP methyl ester carboxylesterase
MTASEGAFNQMLYADGYWWSNDGLRLHYRDYAGPADRPPILCLPGLTRNARDFAVLAERLAPEWRVIALDFRGRGESGYAKDPMTYVPLTYVQDVERLLAELNLSRFILFGTSLGGIVSMLLAATGPARIAGVLLNDIGPVIEQDGLARIRSFVGRAGSWPTWVHAARALGESNAAIYPNYKLEDWLAMAKRLYRLTAQGRVVPDYDKAIAEPFRLPGGEAGVDLWPALKALKSVPALIVRGENSDILSAATATEMQARLPDASLVTVSGVGHAPTLDEPEVITAIDHLLARIAA